MPAAEYEVNKQFSYGVERAMEGIKLQRQADRHKHLIPDLKAALPDIDFKTYQAVVSGKGQKGEILNVQKTIDDNIIADVEDKLNTWLENHYATNSVANDHKLDMESFEASMNRIKGASLVQSRY